MIKITNKKNLFSKSIVCGIILAIFCGFSLRVLAEDNTGQPFDPIKAKLWERIEELKNEQAVFVSQLGSLDAAQDSLSEEITKSEALTKRFEKEIEATKAKRASIASLLAQARNDQAEVLTDLYINSNQNPFIVALFSSESLSDLLRNLFYSRTIAEDINKKVEEINSKVQDLKEENNLLAAQLKESQAQKLVLTKKIEALLDQEKQATDNIERAKINQLNLEVELLSLEVGQVQNNRDFISLNKVDFENSAAVKFIGGGTDHGVGMSQYGAKFLAEKGFSYPSILTYYYQNTKIEKQESDPTIRAKLSASYYGGRIFARGGKWEITGFAQDLPQDGSVDVRSGRVTVFDEKGNMINGFDNPGEIILSSQDPATLFEVTYKNNGFNHYRGKIKVTATSMGLLTINELTMEEYLYGVVPSEVSCFWPEEALKAQALAARSYAFTSLNSGSSWDVDDTTAYQVYLGYDHESESTNKAVDETKNEYIMFGSTVVRAYFFSSSGGFTENNEDVWGGIPRPYLRGVESPEDSPYNSWETNSISRERLEYILNSDPDTSVGKLKTIEILKRGVSGRIMVMKITGDRGEKMVTAQTFKYIVNINLDYNEPLIRSNLFGIKGQ